MQFSCAGVMIPIDCSCVAPCETSDDRLNGWEALVEANQAYHRFLQGGCPSTRRARTSEMTTRIFNLSARIRMSSAGINHMSIFRRLGTREPSGGTKVEFVKIAEYER